MIQLIQKINSWLDQKGEKLFQKEIAIPVDLSVGILFLLFSGFLFITMPQQVTVSEKDVVNGQAFPTLLITVMMICCVILIGREVFKMVTGRPIERKVINLQVEAKALAIFLILLFTYLICKLTGLFVIGAVFCCLGFLFYFRCKKPLYYVITITLAVAIWAAFRFLLGVDF